MPKTIQIRDVEDDLYDQLVKRAAEEGVTVPELLRQEIVRLVSKPSMKEWLERTRRRSSDITREQILADLDEMRGPWPDAGR